MTDSTDRTDVTTKWLRRVARIWSIVVIAFTLFMAVAHIVVPEPETTDYPPIENLLPVVMVLSVLGLAIAWRREAIGGAINVGLFLVHMGLYWIIRGKPFPILAVPTLSAAVVPGVLFLICWWRSRSKSFAHKP
jgi:cytochrome bd-type quinol oxidase subunit 2